MNDELQNIEDMFVANGYERNEVKRCLREKVKEKTEETREYRGVVNIPYVKGLSEQFKSSAVHRSRRAGAGVLTYFAGAGVCSPPVKL